MAHFKSKLLDDGRLDKIRMGKERGEVLILGEAGPGGGPGRFKAPTDVFEEKAFTPCKEFRQDRQENFFMLR